MQYASVKLIDDNTVVAFQYRKRYKGACNVREVI